MRRIIQDYSERTPTTAKNTYKLNCVNLSAAQTYGNVECFHSIYGFRKMSERTLDLAQQRFLPDASEAWSLQQDKSPVRVESPAV